jgi:endoglucanase Acf2
VKATSVRLSSRSAWTLLLAWVFIQAIITPTTQAADIKVGLGSYSDSGSFKVPATKPFITHDFKQPVVSAQWWASLQSQPFSLNLFAHPGSYRAVSSGLEMGYPGSASGSPFAAIHRPDLTLGLDGLTSPDARVAAYSAGTVTARWEQGDKSLEATIGHGLPFAYARVKGGLAKVSATNAVPYFQRGAIVAFTVNRRAYALFAPTGSTWLRSPPSGGAGSAAFTSDLGGKDYFSVAVLPDSLTPTVEYFARFAYAFVTGTSVQWVYHEAQARLQTDFAAKTEVMEGEESGTLFALFPHQWRHSPTTRLPYTYASPRGAMHVVSGASFITNMLFNGILPTLPLDGVDTAKLKTLVQEITSPALSGDTYGNGKAMGKAALGAHLAEAVGDTVKRKALVSGLQATLQSWFTAGGTQQLHFNRDWHSLIGYPASYGSDERLSDHHFHYGYFMQAAAAIARFDQAWARPENWGGMVELLIREVNSWKDDDSLFGRFKYFDPFEGHGWADGMGFDRGNNQESSSESMNFHAGLIQWGAATGNKTLRDLGIFMYTHEARAIEEYWWDVHDHVFPTDYAHPAAGIIWSNGGDFATWFSAEPWAIVGINILPMTPGHLYMARHPNHVVRNHAAGGGGSWNDLFTQYLAFADPAKAASVIAGEVALNTLVIEPGNSRANLYHHVQSLASAGRPDTAITCNYPTASVFTRGDRRTYAFYNPGPGAATLQCSDGYVSPAVASGAQRNFTGPALASVGLRGERKNKVGSRPGYLGFSPFGWTGWLLGRKP